MADKKIRPEPAGEPHVYDDSHSLAGMDKGVLEDYWRRNLRLTLGLLAVWFVVGYLLAIVFAPALNAFSFLGAPLGFWIAQNGAIYVFVLLILIYAFRMNRLDDEFDVNETPMRRRP